MRGCYCELQVGITLGGATLYEMAIAAALAEAHCHVVAGFLWSRNRSRDMALSPASCLAEAMMMRDLMILTWRNE